MSSTVAERDTLDSFDEALRSYQREGVSFLYRNEAALLADEMGLGKTVQAAVALSLALRDESASRALIVCPSSLTLNWERELAGWAPRLMVRRLTGPDAERQALYALPIQVLIASYEQIRVDAIDRIPGGTFDVVILDEAQRIKNKDSRTAFACRLLPRKRAWALSGTPLENSRADLESVFAFLSPGLLTRSMSKSMLFARIAPHMLRRRKSEVLANLPPVIIQDLHLELTAEQRAVYEDIWSRRFEVVGSSSGPIPTTALFALLTRLKQVCNFDRTSDQSSKRDALTTLLEGACGSTDKIIVFSQYVETLLWLSSRLPNISVEIYHGGISDTARDDVIRIFETSPGPRILLMSLRAGGVGLNLQSASVVVLFDRWWNPAVEVQAIYRAHRFDRDRPLHVVRYLIDDSIEERIERILSLKQALFDEYVEGAPSAEVPTLTRGELLQILALDAEGESRLTATPGE